MTGRAIILGIFVAIGLLAVMLYDGWFMKEDREVDCLPYAECSFADGEAAE